MHLGLAHSVRHLVERCQGSVAFDAPALQRLIAEIEAGCRFPPATFGIYYDLVTRLLADEFTAAAELFKELQWQRPIAVPLRLMALGDGAMEEKTERYLRFMDPGSDVPLGFLPPASDDTRAFNACFQDALSAMTQASPDLVSEMRAILSEIIVVAGAPCAPYQFDGGSSYRLWGALFLNVKRGTTRVALIEALAHEAAHSLLFGLTVEETLVCNRDDELYASPLRDDPRPMDGIYHAAFVSARMHWAMSRLIASGLLTDEERALATKARDEDRANFEMSNETVAAHARLTDTGQIILTATRAYMSAAS